MSTATKTLGEQLDSEVRKIFREAWKTRDGQKVLESEDIQLGNHAVKLEGTVLYADLDGSTNMVDNYKPEFAAEIYKTYLHCAAKIIRSEGGQIVSYDGDRIMAVYIGTSKNTDAARTTLKINYAVSEIINPAIKDQYPRDNFDVKQIVGIDTSNLFVARTGIRGSNDLVWVGRSANYAAKLCSESSYYPSWITGDVYNSLNDAAKYGKDSRNMWSSYWWEDRQITVYRSTWYWKV
ncbi:adenylate/guanylate cyclase domain-containing protein [Rubinisphaera italica]|uniref:Adenylate and Guanylate cyclase catalytic domain protein n=1 Tax=Rubinisphaera italica TaxID=2527969 RepID=A0A5C5XPB5_9PLAN|nr:adenylate/guanylate cyclase domain-containing protein [Rubinisphaera italica]TWT64409.1 Adenylate and Guanylate cyclase catalytic domain protein [Rubinisphaera italica]